MNYKNFLLILIFSAISINLAFSQNRRLFYDVLFGSKKIGTMEVLLEKNGNNYVSISKGKVAIDLFVTKINGYSYVKNIVTNNQLASCSIKVVNREKVDTDNQIQEKEKYYHIK